MTTKHMETQAGLSCQKLFGGWPFLDETFQPKRLLSAVAVIRSELAVQLGATPLDHHHYLSPALAREIRLAYQSAETIESRPATPDERRLIDDAIAQVSNVLPAWRPLLGKIIDIKLLVDREVISCSSFAYPQHIFLNRQAFHSMAELCEQIIHEACHVWAYMIEELEPFSPGKNSKDFTLPSGTSNKNITEVLGATYVSATLLDWYHHWLEAPRREDRLCQLGEYKRGCLSLLKNKNQLSWTGRELHDRLREEH